MSGKSQHQDAFPLPHAVLSGDDLLMSDADFAEARRVGFFEIDVTPMRRHLDTLRAFAKRFHTLKEYGPQFNDEHPEIIADLAEGYMIDNHRGKLPTNENQVERFSLKRTATENHWLFYPEAVQEAAEAINTIASLVLKMALRHTGIPEEEWSKASGKCSENKGQNYLLFNHYRPLPNVRGLKAHRDWSNVTVLCTSGEDKAPALQAYIDGLWKDIAASDSNHVVINFGLTLAMLTEQMPEDKRFHASIHRVLHQLFDRSSTVFFMDHAAESAICSQTASGLEEVHKDFEAFSEAASASTYDGIDKKWGDDENEAFAQAS